MIAHATDLDGRRLPRSGGKYRPGREESAIRAEGHRADANEVPVGVQRTRSRLGLFQVENEYLAARNTDCQQPTVGGERQRIWRISIFRVSRLDLAHDAPVPR